jgi:hypothetical protein
MSSYRVDEVILLGSLHSGSECKGVPHEDMLFGLESLCLVLRDILAAGAAAVASTVPVVFEALAVQLQTP